MNIVTMLFELLKLQSQESLSVNLINKMFYLWFQYDSYVLATILIVFSVVIMIMFHDKRFAVGYEILTPLDYTISHISDCTKESNILKINSYNDNYNKVNYVLKSFKDDKYELDYDIILMLNTLGKVIYANKNACKIFGKNVGEVLGETLQQLYSNIGMEDDLWLNEVIKTYDTSNIVRYVSNNQENLVFMNYHANIDKYGKVESIVVSGNDVTKLFNSETMKSFYQKQDQLTGIMNQYGMFEYINQMKDSKFAIAFFIEAMHFTEIINYYGYMFADQLLNEIVKDLKSLADENTLIARYTESKFVVVFFEDNLTNEMIKTYEKKVVEFLNKPSAAGQINIQIDKRAGYSVYPKDTKNLEEIVSLASIALKELVSSNISNIQRYSKNMMEDLKYNLEISNKLKKALDDEKIEVFFQKAINCSNNEIYVMEELSRWYDNELGYISPIEFFRIAKETNQLERLDGYMVKKSLMHFKTLKNSNKYGNSKLTINLSPNTLLNARFFNYFDEVVKVAGLKPNDIYIEISEGTFVNKLDLCIERINKYRDAGYLIALDDFGIEYSSLAILEKVDFDIIKLDAHFVRNMDNLSNQEIIKMIRKITEINKTEMIAEGVETKEQSDKLRELGCLIQQGYYLHRPENLIEV